MLFPWLLALAVPAAAVPSQIPAAGAFQIDFKVFRGNSLSDMAQDRQLTLRKRADSLLMEIDNAASFYKADLKIGSNQQEVGVLVDTGSSDLWVMSKDMTCFRARSAKRDVFIDSPGTHVVRDDIRMAEMGLLATPTDEILDKRACGLFGCTTTVLGTSTATGAGLGGSGNTCTSYGSFETADSDSFQKNSSAAAFSIEYADGTTASGIWGRDTVEIAGTNVSSLSFAVVNLSDSNIGVLGIGLTGLETTNQRSSGGYQYENLPLRLKRLGLINKNAYSLYLGDASATSGSVLFGAVDNAKYTGPLQTVPIINIYASFYRNPIRLDVVLSGISYLSASQNETISTTAYAALLDSGTTLSYFPTGLFSNIVTALLGRYSQAAGLYAVDCGFYTTRASFVFNFSGIQISVPLQNMVLRSGSQCFLGVLENSSTANGVSYVVLGDNFLRSAYVVYDLDDYEISMAQVAYSNLEDIEVILLSVPNAVRAAGYSSTVLGISSSSGFVTPVSSNTGKTSSGHRNAVWALTLLCVTAGVVMAVL